MTDIHDKPLRDKDWINRDPAATQFRRFGRVVAVIGGITLGFSVHFGIQAVHEAESPQPNADVETPILMSALTGIAGGTFYLVGAEGYEQARLLAARRREREEKLDQLQGPTNQEES